MTHITLRSLRPLLAARWVASSPHTPLFSGVHLTHYTTSGILATFDRALVINKLRDLLYKVGIFDDDTQLLGQWKPDTYKRYIEVHLEYTGIHNVSLRL